MRADEGGDATAVRQENLLKKKKSSKRKRLICKFDENKIEKDENSTTLAKTTSKIRGVEGRQGTQNSPLSRMDSPTTSSSDMMLILT